jgi:pimeloyl-ACP methyl ester carboxylesterase
MEVPYHPAVMEDLRARLARSRWPDRVDENWASGADWQYLRRLADYWEHGFDWGAQVERINQVPHFRATVQGLRIHFVYERGTGPHPFPLVITHGWPGSFLEMLRVIPLLAHPERFGGDAADAFDVIVPSLPGYGFSDAGQTPGMDPERIAGLWHELMTGLGYARYGAQGGDWGASVATRLALTLGASGPLVGIHLNYVPGSYRPYLGSGTRELSQAELEFLRRCEEWSEAEGSYAHQQRTKPATLAFGLTDSPLGLAAWIVEKLQSWSDCAGNLDGRFTLDEVLTSLTLYWTTGTIGSSIRLYREGARNPLHFGEQQRVQLPCAFALFPAETPANPPREWVERGYQVRRWTTMPRGGHFAAWEEPELLAQDVREFFRDLRDLT